MWKAMIGFVAGFVVGGAVGAAAAHRGKLTMLAPKAGEEDGE